MRATALAIALTAVCACERADRSESPPAPSVPAAPAAEVAVATAGLVAPGVDLPQLKFDGEDRQVLAREGAKAYVTAGEYNAWLGTYPLNLQTNDPEAARAEAVRQMVFIKLVTERARAAGYEAKVSPSGEVLKPNALAIAYMRDQLTQIGGISDTQATAFASEHRELAPILDDPNLPREVWMLAVKGAIRGDQLRTDIEAWRVKRGIEYDASITQ